MGICGDSEIQTSGGVKRLGDIGPADRVMGIDGKFHAVLAKDYGLDSPAPDFVEIRTESATLITTADHIIDGKPIQDWKPGDKITVNGSPAEIVSAGPCAHEEAGDLLPEGNTYLVNGFPVQSMLGSLATHRQAIETKNADRADVSGFVRDVTRPTDSWAKKEVA